VLMLHDWLQILIPAVVSACAAAIAIQIVGRLSERRAAHRDKSVQKTA